MGVINVVKRLLSRAVLKINNYSRIFPAYIRLRDLVLGSDQKRMLYSKETELVIEGFPRSANTFAVLAFDYAQPDDVKLAHQLHAPS